MSSRVRICKICGEEIIHKSESSFKVSIKNNSPCRKCSHITQKRSNVKILNDGSYESLYWVGFILADGHISEKSCIFISLSNKDKDHLQKLSEYCSSKIRVDEKYCHLVMCDIINNLKLKNSFEIDKHKTVNPPTLNIFDSFSYEQKLAIFAGFIDGDGHISKKPSRPDFFLTIKCHSSWLYILDYFSKEFLNNCTVKINNQGYSSLACNNSTILKTLKQNVEKLNIPILKRKWDAIDTQYKTRYEIASERRVEIEKYLKLGYSQKKIGNLLGMAQQVVSVAVRKYNLNIKI